jgi:hypothetical protein
MKKATLTIGLTLIICLVVGFSYLIYKTYDIFGFWTLTWTGILSIASTSYLGHFIGSRHESNGVITYNPKELPKLINIFVSIAIGYYLYTIINVVNISDYDYIFGMTYLLLLTAVPIIFVIYKLIRDRNDFIVIDSECLKYRDNDKYGDFRFIEIVNVELSGGIKLTLNDGKVVTIETANMNFNAKDLLNVYSDIKSKLLINDSTNSQN